MFRATFTSQRIELDEPRPDGGSRVHCFLTLVDQDIGMSITNDVENVLATLCAAGEYKPGLMRLVYRDTDGIWDEIVTDERGGFVGFRSLGGARDCGTALRAAISLRYLQ